MSTTGERIRELRLRNHLSLDDVARHLGVGRQAIHKYEQGTVTNIPLENIEKMANLFGTTPGYLAGWNDSPKMKFLEMTMSLDPSLVDDVLQDRETNRQKNEKRRQEELKLIHILDKLSDEGREYLIQQAEIALRAYGERK